MREVRALCFDRSFCYHFLVLHAGVAQLFRASACHAEGQGLESPHPHQLAKFPVTPLQMGCFLCPIACQPKSRSSNPSAFVYSSSPPYAEYMTNQSTPQHQPLTRKEAHAICRQLNAADHEQQIKNGTPAELVKDTYYVTRRNTITRIRIKEVPAKLDPDKLAFAFWKMAERMVREEEEAKA